MALTVGSRLAHYDVTALIGEGGMGQVYQATDTKLNRQVALKILPEAFATDPDRLARFQREAQVLASLNHPNIAQIHGIEEAEDTRALVLELVEGPTLADRIGKGPIPIDEALPIAKQIAEALEAAHEAGVIHRDLKPANVVVKDDGTVKVLDFGLAKALDPSQTGDPSQSPTLTAAATQMGVIMGTAAYMSPEQAAGKSVDKRSDIWSFGVVLFEMLTGERLFKGETVSHVLASVLKTEPDWALVGADTSQAILRLLRRSLKKERKDRLPDVAVARLEIEEALTVTDQPEETRSHTPTRPNSTNALPWVAGLVLASIAGLVGWSLAPTATRPVERFVVRAAPSPSPSVSDYQSDIAISPGGIEIIYPAGSADSSQLYVRTVDQLDGTLLEGTDLGRDPFTSPDGAWIGFFSAAEESWKRVPISGGPATDLFSSAPPVSVGSRGASWGLDDTIVFAHGGVGLFRGPVGGAPVPLTEPDASLGETRHYWPEILPGGEAVLFTVITDLSQGGAIAVLDLTTNSQKTLVPVGSRPRYAATGHIVYGVGGALWAVPFDLGRLEVTGDPVRVLEGVQTKGSTSVNFSLSGDGSLAYLAGDTQQGGQRTLVWVDRLGQEEQLGAPSRPYESARIAPGGDRIALEVRDEEGDIWTWDSIRLTRLTFDPNSDRAPLWTPDGDRVLFRSTRAGLYNVYSRLADGTGTAERLVESPLAQYPFAVSSDGTNLVFGQRGQRGDLRVLALDSDGESEPLLATPFEESEADLSPDGRWLAYKSDSSGRVEVYVTSFPAAEGRYLVSGVAPPIPRGQEEGFALRWGPDGRELFYVSDRGLIRVPIEFEGGLSVGLPETLFSLEGYAPTFDVAPDGQRFLLLREDSPAGETTRPRVVLVQNWHQELLERVPVN